MMTRAAASFVPGPMILAGVLMLVYSVFNPWLLWAAVASLALGIALFAACCVSSRQGVQPDARGAQDSGDSSGAVGRREEE